MIQHKYVGFITNKINYSDNDAIINVLTNNGKKTFKARGINKITSKNSASCNYFMISEFVTTSKSENSNQSLKSSSVVNIYKKCYEDILVSSTYLCIASLLDNLSSQINGYDIALKCFDKLEEDVYPLDVLNYFLKNVIIALGYAPNVKGCINCNNKNNLISFDFESGGFICKNCFDETRYNKLTTLFLKDLYDFLKIEDFITLNELHSITLFKMFNAFFKDVIGIDNKCFDFVIKCL